MRHRVHKKQFLRRSIHLREYTKRLFSFWSATAIRDDGDSRKESPASELVTRDKKIPSRVSTQLGILAIPFFDRYRKSLTAALPTYSPVLPAATLSRHPGERSFPRK
jgi:hypothetical protein